MRLTRAWLLPIALVFTAPSSFADMVTLSCSVDISSAESQYFPRFGFSGKQRWDNVLVRVLPTTPTPHVVIKNLAILSGDYQAELTIDEEMKFQRIVTHNQKYWGVINRVTGKLFITEESWPGPTFHVSGSCKVAEKLF